MKKQQSWSYFNPKCEVRQNQHDECAVYARESILKGELISLWGGDIVPISKLDPSMPRFAQRVLQIDEELCILTAEEKEPNDCFNHSCDPNLGFSGQIGLVAMRDIEAGEELTFDYKLDVNSSSEQKKRYACRCKAPNCRGTMLALPKG